MVYAQPLLPVLIVLLLVAVATQPQAVKTATPDRLGGLARLGFALAKIGLLLVPLEWMMHLYTHAEPLALSGKAIWQAALTQCCQIYLAISSMADVSLAIAQLRGLALPEICQAPYRAGSFSGLWQRLHLGLSKSQGPMLSRLLPSIVLVGGIALLWHGHLRAVSVWFIVQMLLLTLEIRRGKSLFAPLPLPLRVLLVMLVMVVTQVLLITPSFDEALKAWQKMFSQGQPTLYSLMLDKRLASAWQQSMLFLAVLTSIGLPTLSWILQQPIKSWRVIGIALGPLSLLLVMREVPNTPPMLQQAAQWPVSWLFGEGNARVHDGHDHWLFPQRELDRLTLQRRQPGATTALVQLAEALKPQGVPLIVVAMPAKAALYPDQILRAEYTAPVQPPGLKARLEELRRVGVEVVDPSQTLWDRLIRAEAYFQNDSHWTPETMKEVATITAKLIRQKWPALPQADTPLIQASILERQDLGDLASALLPHGERLFGVESAQLVSIRGLERDARSPILLVGGDLLRVFEDGAASFGNAEGLPQHAGFATQLAALLGRPLDIQETPSASDLFDPELARQAQGKKLVVILLRADAL